MQFLSVQHLASADFTYNDLFYRVQYKNENDVLKREHKEQVVLINTAFFQPEIYRGLLSDLINKLETYEPKAVGIDVTFSNRSDEQTELLLETISTYDNIVCAKSAIDKTANYLKLPTSIKMGDVDFLDEQHSIRYYKGGKETFAYKLFEMSRGGKAYNEVAEEERFPIAYSSIHDGIVGFDDIESNEYQKNYKVIDAVNLLKEDEQSAHFLSALKNSIVIIGHLGSSQYDIEDKHPVPTDTLQLVNRTPIMPGAAIHANALSNILDNHIMHKPNTLLVEIIVNLVLFLMILVVLIHPLKIFIFLGLTLFSLIWIWLSLYLMEFNIYIQVGTTLIELLILEEFVETFDPFVVRLWEKFKSRRKKNLEIEN
jgi:CHASE2 domain-containing sensor protein